MSHARWHRGFRRIARFELLAVGDELPSPDQVRAYLDQLMARAHRRPPEQAHLRVFQRKSRILVDLANGAGEVVEIDVTGCRVTQQSDVRFLRPGGTEAMVTPVFGGDYRQLRRFIRLPEPAFLLFVAHLTYQFCDGAPQPIMVLAGEQGRSKTTVAKMVQMLTDPREPAVRQLPPSSRDLMVAARHSRVLNFDNVSVIKQALSDTLCSLSTGGGYGIRTGHTDTEETRFDARRPIVLGGIGNFVVRDDLRDRCVFYELEPIAESERVAEGPLWNDFKAALPTILGGLFNLCSRALGAVDAVKPAKLYRMADFYLWALAIQQVAGWPDGSIDAAYGDQRAASDVEAMEADLVVAITRLLSTDGHWSGTASALVEALKAIPGLASGALPRSASKLGGDLQRIAPLLRRNNIDVQNQRTGSSRKIILALQGASLPSLVSPPSQGSSATLPANHQAFPATRATPQILGKPASDGSDGSDGMKGRRRCRGGGTFAFSPAAHAHADFTLRLATRALREQSARRVSAGDCGPDRANTFRSHPGDWRPAPGVRNPGLESPRRGSEASSRALQMLLRARRSRDALGSPRLGSGTTFLRVRTAVRRSPSLSVQLRRSLARQRAGLRSSPRCGTAPSRSIISRISSTTLTHAGSVRRRSRMAARTAVRCSGRKSGWSGAMAASSLSIRYSSTEIAFAQRA